MVCHALAAFLDLVVKRSRYHSQVRSYAGYCDRRLSDSLAVPAKAFGHSPLRLIPMSTALSPEDCGVDESPATRNLIAMFQSLSLYSRPETRQQFPLSDPR